MTEVYYFGCGVGNVGHYWHIRDPANFYSSPPREQWLQLETLFPKVDTGYLPPPTQTQGKARLTVEGEYTILGWWDRTGDSRYGSHATFIAKGTHTLDGMLVLAQERFPSIMSRQPTRPFLA